VRVVFLGNHPSGSVRFSLPTHAIEGMALRLLYTMATTLQAVFDSVF